MHRKTVVQSIACLLASVARRATVVLSILEPPHFRHSLGVARPFKQKSANHALRLPTYRKAPAPFSRRIAFSRSSSGVKSPMRR